MYLSDIESKVNASIRPEEVYGRMLALAVETIELSAEHKRRASYSPCECPYCAAIKVYVRAKIRCKRLRDRDDLFLSRMIHVPSNIDIHNAEQAVVVARAWKEAAKTQITMPALLIDDST